MPRITTEGTKKAEQQYAQSPESELARPHACEGARAALFLPPAAERPAAVTRVAVLPSHPRGHLPVQPRERSAVCGWGRSSAERDAFALLLREAQAVEQAVRRGRVNPGRWVCGVYLKHDCRRLSRRMRFAGGAGLGPAPPWWGRSPSFSSSAATVAVAEASFPSLRPPTWTHCSKVMLIPTLSAPAVALCTCHPWQRPPYHGGSPSGPCTPEGAIRPVARRRSGSCWRMRGSHPTPGTGRTAARGGADTRCSQSPLGSSTEKPRRI